MEQLPTYEQLYASFRWNIPARYNIAADVCDRHAADASKIALTGEGPDGKTWRMSFRDIQRKANQLANLFASSRATESCFCSAKIRGPQLHMSRAGKPA
jgi:acetyl-CoA synthetase